MAYLNYLAPVNWDDVLRFRADQRNLLKPSTVIAISHLVAYWVKEKPLGQYLSEIVDGGEDLSDGLWHPLRHPRVLKPELVISSHELLRGVWDDLNDEERKACGFEIEIDQILDLLQTARFQNEGIVSVLEPPADRDRADRVLCPFADVESLPPRGDNCRRLRIF